MARRHAVWSTAILVLVLAASPASAQLLANDSWISGQAVNFQAGFVAGETAAVRLVPAGPCPCQVDEVRFLFGGAGTTEDVTLRIWNDTGAAAPGTLVYSEAVQLTGTTDFMQSIDLRAHGVMVDGPFRVGLEFTHDGLPSVATDTDGLAFGDNFIDEISLGWVDSALFFISGDFVIRAVVDSGTPGSGTLLANDGWISGQPAAFQDGFVAGETAAVRLAPAGPCPCRLDRIQLLFGGATGTHDVILHVWDDSAATIAPGPELYSTTVQLTGSNEFLQEVPIGAVGLMIDGPVRIGLEFTHAGLPSVARDDDGLQPGLNFIDDATTGWADAQDFGLPGDWVIRAVLDASTASGGTLLANDTWLPGQTAAFQDGFVAGETAAVRLTPAGPCPCPIERVQFLFGGASGTHDVTLHVWDDSAGTDDPGAELYAATFELTGSDEFLQEIDIRVAGVTVNGPFRVGLEFSHSGLPSVARDVDGLDPGRSFIDDASLGWVDAVSKGLTGDWIIRAVLPDGGAAGELLNNDTWIPGQTVAFQAGFTIGETPAARFVPGSPCPCRLDQIRFLWGGDPGTETVILHVWDDAALTDAPGAEIYSAPIQLTGSDLFLQQLDLTVAGILVNGPFRVGFELQHAGVPSLATDEDGIVPDRNFVDETSQGWVEASTVGLTGDWVLRAVLDSLPGALVAVDSFAAASPSQPAPALLGGDVAATRLVPAGPCPCPVEDVRVLFTGGSESRVVTLHVWEDAGPGVEPGPELYTRDVSLTPSDQVLQVIDLQGEGVVVDGAFRIGIELRSNAPPGVAVDDDGLTPGRSFVRDAGGWTDADIAGATGDWILRATVGASGAGVPALSPAGLAALALALVGAAFGVARRR